jgi:hypothetical protein
MSSSELILLKTALDLAAAKQSDQGMEERISYHSLLNAFKDVCQKLQPNPQMEQRCFQALLLMSADDADPGRTWWDKVHDIQIYLDQLLSQKSTKLSATTGSQFNSSRVVADTMRGRSASPSVSRRSPISNEASDNPLQPRTNYVMRLSDKARQIQGTTSTTSSMSPSLLREGTELSLLLNDRTPLRASAARLLVDDLHATPTSPSSTQHRLNLNSATRTAAASESRVQGDSQDSETLSARKLNISARHVRFESSQHDIDAMAEKINELRKTNQQDINVSRFVVR